MLSRSPFAAGPFWSRLAVPLVGLAGLITVAVAWYGTTGRVDVERQTGWVGLGATGAAITCLAMGAWLVRGRSAIRARLASIDLSPVQAGPSLGPDPPAEDLLVVAPNMGHYHRWSCALAQGKPVEARPRREHEAAGRRQCGVCRA